MISFAIVNWNGGDVFKRCVDSIDAAMRQVGPETSYEIIVVDNASADLDLAWTSAQPRLRLIRNDQNLLFAKATNQSVASARGETLIILNNDICLKVDSVKKLLATMATSDFDAIAPRLIGPDGKLQRSLAGFPKVRDLLLACTGLSTIFPGLDHWIKPRFDYERSQPTTLQPAFSAILIRRAAWQRTGDMDEQFPLLWNDADWFYRFYQAGLRCYYLADSVAIHYHGMSTRKLRFRKIIMSITAMRLYFKKHGSNSPAYRLAVYLCSSVLLLLGLILELKRFVFEKLAKPKQLAANSGSL